MRETRDTVSSASTDTNRRAVLKAAGATAAAGLGGVALSGTAGARDVHEVTADRAAAETVFDWHAGELLDDLAADGVIDDRSALDLTPDDFGTMVADRDGAAVLRDRETGVHEVRSVRQVDGGELSVTVEVETGKAYALFYPAATDERLLYNPDIDVRGREVGTLCHTCTCTCSNLICEWPYESEECECCCDGDCHTDYYCRC